MKEIWALAQPRKVINLQFQLLIKQYGYITDLTNNRVENAYQPTRKKEKCLIKFKSPCGWYLKGTVKLKKGQIYNIG